MHLKFRIDWGYIFLYSRRLYHPEYSWDGHLELDNGQITQVWKLNYPYIWFGPGDNAKLTPLASPCWKDKTKRALSGIMVEAETEPDGLFTLVTASGTFRFTAREIQENGRIVFPVGSKYSHCTVIVTRHEYFWFRPPANPGEVTLEGQDIALSHCDHARMHCARLDAGASMEIPLAGLAAPTENGGIQTLLHIQAMAAGLPEDYVDPADSYGGPGIDRTCEIPIDGIFKLEIYDENANLIKTIGHYFRAHDGWMQLLEDVWAEFDLPANAKSIKLKNCHERLPLMFSRVIVRRQNRQHIQLSLPSYLLKDEPFTGRVFAQFAEDATISVNGQDITLALQPGWNDFPISLPAGQHQLISIKTATAESSAEVPIVYDLAEESIPVKVGYDLTTVPHDKFGDLDWLLDYTWRTRLGNYMALRNFHKFSWTSPEANPPDELLTKWGKAAARHHIYLQATNGFLSGALRDAAGPWLHNAGSHENGGEVYAFNPDNISVDMKDAERRYIAKLKTICDEIHDRNMIAAIGDATGGHRCHYQAGFDYLRSETCVPHTMLLLSQARGAAQAYDRKEWGVHIAIQHAKQPFLKNQLGIYFLSLFQPWIMGATFLYEEDSLFLQFKEERMCWDDFLTKSKRDMTREFFRFAKTHPRQAASERAIAVVQGRYAAPFNGFICDTEQDPNYSVWGKYGRSDSPNWGHRQPEKVFQLLDVLMPGASTHPLLQDPEKRRFFFSGTPFGDFDQMPIEAPSRDWASHRLAILFGWNTLLEEDVERMRNYVENGGCLLTSLSSFCTSTSREILNDTSTMPLWHNGDLADILGIRVKGNCTEFSGSYRFLTTGFAHQPSLSRIPSASPDEDGICPLPELEFCGAEPVAVDAQTKRVMAIRFKLGKGYVWCLTAMAFAGHEKLSDFSSALLYGLASQHQTNVRIENESNEVFWSWQPVAGSNGHLLALNTDWTTPGNQKHARVITPKTVFDIAITERQLKQLTVLENVVLEYMDDVPPSVTITGSSSIRLVSDKNFCRIRIHHADGTTENRNFGLQPAFENEFAF